MSICVIFVVLLFVDVVRGNCNDSHVTLIGDTTFRYIQSPNYGDEYRKRSSSVWNINLPSQTHYVILYIEDLQLHYGGHKIGFRCIPSYDLRINGEKFGCGSDEYLTPQSNDFCIRFRTPACSNVNTCDNRDREIVDKVQIAFCTSGEEIQPRQTPLIKGFRIRYGIFRCPGVGSIDMPPTTVSSSPGRTVSLSTSISTEKTTMTTTTTTAATTTATKVKMNTSKAILISSKSSGISSTNTDSSTKIQITLSNVGNATHGPSHSTSTTSPTANKNQGEEDSNTKLSFTIDLHWIILASAIAGGVLLILIVVVCCKIQRKKKTTVHDNEIEAVDADLTPDKTEPPVYSVVEDGPSNQKSSQEEEATYQNATQLDSNNEEKLVVENVAYVTSQESPITSVSQPNSTLSESIQNDGDKATIIDESGDEFYSVVRLKSNKEKTTVRYLKESLAHIDAP